MFCWNYEAGHYFIYRKIFIDISTVKLVLFLAIFYLSIRGVSQYGLVFLKKIKFVMNKYWTFPALNQI